MRRSKQAAHREGSADPLLCFSNVHPLRGELMEAGSGKNLFGFTSDEKACVNASALESTRKSLHDKLKWSSSAFVETGDAWLEEKIEQALGLDPVNAYPTQLLEYDVSESEKEMGGIVDYKRHTDCGGELDINAGAITLLIYLTTADENGSQGGDTVFPVLGRKERRIGCAPGSRPTRRVHEPY